MVNFYFELARYCLNRTGKVDSVCWTSTWWRTLYTCVWACRCNWVMRL